MIRICLTWAHEQNVPPQGNCLSNTVWRYFVVLEASFVQGGSYQLCEGAHLGKFEERVSLLTWTDNRREIVDTNFGHKSSEKCVPLTPSAILSKIGQISVYKLPITFVYIICATAGDGAKKTALIPIVYQSSFLYTSIFSCQNLKVF